MKKSTHRPSQPSSKNLPARAESDRETATGDNGCLVFLAVGVKGGGCAAQNWASHNFKTHGSPHETFARTDLDGHRHPCLVRHASRPSAFAKGLWGICGGEDSGDAGSRRRRSLAATSTNVPGWIRSLASRSRTANNGNAETQGLNRSRRCDRALRRAAWVRKTRGVRRRLGLCMSGPLPFMGGSWIGQLGPDTRIGLGKQIAPSDGTVCKFLNCSRMHHWHSSLTCDPFRDDRRLYAKVLSKTNTSASDRIEPFNKFFHAHMIRPSLIDFNRNCLIGDDS